jgi:hypothetical protein
MQAGVEGFKVRRPRLLPLAPEGGQERHATPEPATSSPLAHTHTHTHTH